VDSYDADTEDIASPGINSYKCIRSERFYTALLATRFMYVSCSVHGSTLQMKAKCPPKPWMTTSALRDVITGVCIKQLSHT
jgi:hypothetical protein